MPNFLTWYIEPGSGNMSQKCIPYHPLPDGVVHAVYSNLFFYHGMLQAARERIAAANKAKAMALGAAPDALQVRPLYGLHGMHGVHGPHGVLRTHGMHACRSDAWAARQARACVGSLSTSSNH